MGFAAPSIASTCQLLLPAPSVTSTCHFHLPPATPNRHPPNRHPHLSPPRRRRSILFARSNDALIKNSERVRYSQTRREYVPIGSGAASLLRTVREYLPRPPLCETGSVGKQNQAAT